MRQVDAAQRLPTDAAMGLEDRRTKASAEHEPAEILRRMEVEGLAYR